MKDIAKFILLSVSVVLFGCKERTTEPSSSNLPLEIAFTSNQSGDDDIYVMTSDGSDQTRLTTNPDKDWFPRWSPGGERIAFLSTRGNDTQLYVMNSDGTNQLRVSSGVTFISGYADIQWSPSSRFIAFTAFDDRNVSHVYIVNADGTNQRILTLGSFPNWSGDENALICSGNGIFSINIDGTNVRRLTDTAFFDFNPVLSPRRDKIVFKSFRDNDSGRASLHIMNTDGSGLRELIHKDADNRPTWTPDGSAILFLYSEYFGASPKILEVDTSGTNEHEIVANAGTIRSTVCFSSTGNRIVFSSLSDIGLRIDVYVKDLNTNSIARLTSHTNVLVPTNDYPDWKSH